MKKPRTHASIAGEKSPSLLIPQSNKLESLALTSSILTEKDRLLFLADCIEHVMPRISLPTSDKLAVNAAIQAAREFARGIISRLLFEDTCTVVMSPILTYPDRALIYRGVSLFRAVQSLNGDNGFEVLLEIGDVASVMLRENELVCDPKKLHAERDAQEMLLEKYLMNAYGEAVSSANQLDLPLLMGDHSDIVLGTIVREQTRQAALIILQSRQKKLPSEMADNLNLVFSAMQEHTDGKEWWQAAFSTKKDNPFWKKVVRYRFEPNKIAIPRKKIMGDSIGASPKSLQGKLQVLLLALEKEVEKGHKANTQTLESLIHSVYEFSWYKLRQMLPKALIESLYARTCDALCTALSLPLSPALSTQIRDDIRHTLYGTLPWIVASLQNPNLTPPEAKELFSFAIKNGHGKRAWEAYQRSPSYGLHLLEDPGSIEQIHASIPEFTKHHGYTFKKLEEAIEEFKKDHDMYMETTVDADYYERDWYEDEDGRCVRDTTIPHPGFATLDGLMKVLWDAALLVREDENTPYQISTAIAPVSKYYLWNAVQRGTNEDYFNRGAFNTFLESLESLSDKRGTDTARAAFLEDVWENCAFDDT